MEQSPLHQKHKVLSCVIGINGHDWKGSEIQQFQLSYSAYKGESFSKPCCCSWWTTEVKKLTGGTVAPEGVESVPRASGSSNLDQYLCYKMTEN